MPGVPRRPHPRHPALSPAFPGLNHKLNNRIETYDAAIRTKEYKYGLIGTGEEEFYDLEEDPYELVNEIDNPAYEEIIADLRSQLEELKAS